MAKYNFIIKNGIIFDGEGNDFAKNDIGIKNDKIKSIGKLEENDAERVIDANAMYIAPGFIDLTSHSDTFWTIFSDPFQESLVRQGITTILGGNCGSSLAPIVSSKNIESIQKWTDISKINIDWQNLDEFLDKLEINSLGINFATLIGHGTLRRNVVGDETRRITESELKKMKFLLERSLKRGAYGLSFSLGSAHEKEASAKEITELAKTVKEYDGLVKHHLEDEGKNILPAIAHLVGYARESRAKTQISHFKAIGRSAWEKFEEALSLIERARGENLALTLDVFPYTKTGSNLYLLLPEWARKNGKSGILSMLRDPEERKNIIQYLKNITLHYERITVASTLWDASSVGKTLAEISESTGFAPEEVILNLLELNELKVSIFNEAVKEENIEKLLRKPYVMISSDGAGYDSQNFKSQISSPKSELYHPRSFGAFPRVFSEFVKNKKAITWQEAIYKSAGFPAKILGLSERGTIKNGSFADIVIFNPEKIQDKATYKNPFQFSEGVEWVFVNGESVLEAGEMKMKKAGKVLRRK